MRRALLVVMVLGFLLPGAAAAYTPPPIHHVFVLVDENESASTTFGSGSPAPYLSQTLVGEGAYLPNYYAIGHNSLDNYIALVSGQAPNPLTSGDCHEFVDFPGESINSAGQEEGEGCIYPGNVPSLMSQLDGVGLSWRAYEDGMGADPSRESSTCGHPAIGQSDNTQKATPQDQYATRHDPFVYFHYVIDNQSECNANVVNLNQLSTDLQSAGSTPNYVFITPNLCDDGHDPTCANGGPGGLSQADSFLRTWVPKITSSPAFEQSGLLIITFDEGEGDSSACCNETPGPYDAAHGIEPGGNGPGGGRVGAVLLSPFIVPGTTSSTPYDHYSLLGSVEDIFGLSRLGDAVGTSAFGPDVYTRAPATSVPVGPVLAAPGASTISRSQLAALLLQAITPVGRVLRISRHARVFDLRFPAPEAGRALVQWYETTPGSRHARARSTLVASGAAVFLAAATKTIRMKLTSFGRRLLQKGKRLKLTAKSTFTPSGGKPVSAVRTFTLKP